MCGYIYRLCINSYTAGANFLNYYGLSHISNQERAYKTALSWYIGNFTQFILITVEPVTAKFMNTVGVQREK